VRLPLKGSGFINPYLVPGAYDKPSGPWDNTVSPRAERSPPPKGSGLNTLTPLWVCSRNPPVPEYRVKLSTGYL